MAYDAFDRLFGKVENSGNFLSNAGEGALGGGLSTLQSPISYYQKLLNGDQTATSEALGPEISQISSAYNSTRGNIANFSPRGGGQVSSINNAGTAEAGQIGSLVGSVRPEAAKALGTLGTEEANLGLGSINSSTSDFNSIISGLLQQEGLGVTQQQAQAAQGQSIGQLIALFASAFA